MLSWTRVAAALVGSILAAGVTGPFTEALAGSKKTSLNRHSESGRAFVLENRRRASLVRIPLPLGPSYIYQDYPYYYSRGHYPAHIGGYTYYPPPSRWHADQGVGQKCAWGPGRCAAYRRR